MEKYRNPQATEVESIYKQIVKKLALKKDNMLSQKMEQHEHGQYNSMVSVVC